MADKVEWGEWGRSDPEKSRGDYMCRRIGSEYSFAYPLEKRALVKKRYDPNCQECRGTGQRDSGGTYPWGESIFLACDCDVPPAPVVETVRVNGGHEGPFGWTFQENVDGSGITHRITLTIIDGVVQHTATVVML